MPRRALSDELPCIVSSLAVCPKRKLGSSTNPTHSARHEPVKAIQYGGGARYVPQTCCLRRGLNEVASGRVADIAAMRIDARRAVLTHLWGILSPYSRIFNPTSHPSAAWSRSAHTPRTTGSTPAEVHRAS